MIQCGGLRGRAVPGRTCFPRLPVTSLVGVEAGNGGRVKVLEGLRRPGGVGIKTSRCGRVGRLGAAKENGVQEIVKMVLGFSEKAWEMVGAAGLEVYFNVLGFMLVMRVMKTMKKPLGKVWWWWWWWCIVLCLGM